MTNRYLTTDTPALVEHHIALLDKYSELGMRYDALCAEHEELGAAYLRLGNTLDQYIIECEVLRTKNHALCAKFEALRNLEAEYFERRALWAGSS